MYKVVYINNQGEKSKEKFDNQDNMVSFLQTINYLDCEIISVKMIGGMDND